MNSLIDDLLDLQTHVAPRLTPLRFALLERMRWRTGGERPQPAQRPAQRGELKFAQLACATTGVVKDEQTVCDRSEFSLGAAAQDRRLLIRLVARENVDICCMHGVLWVTVRGSVKDWILYPGHRVALSPGQEATATGLPFGDMRIEHAGGSAD